MKSSVLLSALAACMCSTVVRAQYEVTSGATTPPAALNKWVTVYDPTNSKTIINGSLGYLYDNQSGVAMNPTAINITPSVTDPLPNPDSCDGFDIEYVFDNTSGSTAQYVGAFTLPGLVFGSTGSGNDIVRTRGFRWDETGQARDLNASGGNFFTNENVYPGGIFSPVLFLHSGNYGIGLSVNYPIIDPACTTPYTTTGCATQYGHGIYTNTWTGGGSPKSWNMYVGVSGFFWPGTLGGGSGNTQGMVPAYGSRTYTVSVRIKNLGAAPTVSNANSSPLVEGEQSWLEVFKPYKAYFDARYRGQSYTMKSCPSPVLGGGVGYPGGLEGFTTVPPAWTDYPHLDGFHAHKSLYENEEANGWYRRMLWAPSGCFNDTTHTSAYDYPFQFMSGWSRFSPPLSSSDDIRILQPLADSTRASGVGEDLGMWWGNSTTIMNAWHPNSTQVWELNPIDTTNSPTDPVRWWAELALALTDSAGPKADMIGLDAFGMPIGKRYHWLKAMMAAYPKIGFIQEAMPSDVMATLSAGYVRQQDIKSPHYLAQLLIPGHEFWGSVEHQLMQNPSSYPEFQAKAELFASWGYTPLCFTYGLDITSDIADMTADVPDVVPCSMLVPVIYTNLPSQTVMSGRGTDEMTVVVGSTAAHTFTWQKDTGSGWATVTDSNASGINTTTLKFTNIEYNNGGDYRLKIEYGQGNCTSAVIYSNVVSLRICGPKDYDGDGNAGDQNDIDAFWACLGGTCCPNCWGQDIDGDGSHGTDSDIEAFLRIMDDEPC